MSKTWNVKNRELRTADPCRQEGHVPLGKDELAMIGELCRIAEKHHRIVW